MDTLYYFPTIYLPSSALPQKTACLKDPSSGTSSFSQPPVDPTDVVAVARRGRIKRIPSTILEAVWVEGDIHNLIPHMKVKLISYIKHPRSTKSTLIVLAVGIEGEMIFNDLM